MDNVPISQVQCINWEHVPDELVDEAIENDMPGRLSTVHDDGSGLSEWLKSIGFVFDADRNFTWIGIYA